MLRPTKHSHPDKTVLYASTVILKKIKKSRVETIDNLRHHLRNSITSADFLFYPALNLLYLLGTIDYRPKNDSIEYLKR